MSEFSKPKVTIDLEEYLELKKRTEEAQSAIIHAGGLSDDDISDVIDILRTNQDPARAKSILERVGIIMFYDAIEGKARFKKLPQG